MKSRCRAGCGCLTLLLLALPLQLCFGAPAQDSLLAIPPAPSEHSLQSSADPWLDAAQERGAALWDLLHPLPPGTALRARVEDVGANRPRHLFRLRYRTPEWELSGMVHRDAGEQNGADLLRATLLIRRHGLELLLGDYRVDAAHGWVVAGTPSWPSPTNPLAPLRRPEGGVRPMLSSMEGRGWRGIAVAGNVEPALVAIVERIRGFGWVGQAHYDARWLDGGLVPYSSQGDHTGSRAETANKLQENSWGARLMLQRPLNLPVQMGGTLLASTFQQPIPEEDLPGRFRGAHRGHGALGLDMSTGNRSSRLLSAEWAFQRGGASGGSVMALQRLGNRSVSSAAFWRATAGFQPLHAQPYQAYGDDPAGKTGGQLALRRRMLPDVTTAIGLIAQWREAVDGAVPSRRLGFYLNNEIDLSDLWSLGTRAIFSQGHEPSEETASTTLRARVTRESRRLRSWLRGEWVGRGANRGGLVALGIRGEAGHGLGISAAATYLRTIGKGVTLTIIEPAAPGAFPVSRSGGHYLRGACRLSYEPFAGSRLWCRVQLDHNLGIDKSLSPTGRRLDLGLDWRGGH